MTDVPPEARCVRDGCDREGIDPEHPAPLCPRHLPAAVAEPLELYEPKGYAEPLSGDRDLRERARDAAVAATASRWGPPFDTDVEDAGVWWKPAYGAACMAVERAIVDALLRAPDPDTVGADGGREVSA